MCYIRSWHITASLNFTKFLTYQPLQSSPSFMTVTTPPARIYFRRLNQANSYNFFHGDDFWCHYWPNHYSIQFTFSLPWFLLVNYNPTLSIYIYKRTPLKYLTVISWVSFLYFEFAWIHFLYDWLIINRKDHRGCH